jgi:hypothetical protein
MKVHFKLKPGVDESDRDDLFRLVRAKGATRVRRLFPKTASPNLKNHYVADAPTAADVRKLVSLLQGRTEVAFAQHEVKRPVRPRPRPPGG